MNRREFLDVAAMGLLCGCLGQNVLAEGAEKLASAKAGQSAALKKSPRLLRVYVINVNNEDWVNESLLIVGPNGKTMLIDAGWNSGFTRPNWGERNYGQNIIPDFLKKKGIKTIDWMMMSHPHDDHMGGFPELILDDEIVVKEFLWSPVPESKLAKAEPGYAEEVYHPMLKRIREACAAKGVPIVAIKGDETIDMGAGVKYEVLTAARPELDVPNYINNNSVIAKLTYGEFRMMFTGDAGIEQEARVLAKHKDLQCDVLKVGHHAGAGSTSEAWLKAVSPKIAVASLPKWLSNDPRGQRVEEMLTKRKITFYRTWEHGTIEIRSDGQGVRVVPEITPEKQAVTSK